VDYSIVKYNEKNMSDKHLFSSKNNRLGSK